MIQLKAISKSFGQTKAVNRVSFSVNEGETLVLLGTSGCGKSTTLKMINRLITPSEGKIFVNGKDIESENVYELRKQMGYVMQGVGLFPHYTIAENIAVVAKLLKWNKSEIEGRTQELMYQLHLPESFLSQYPNQLSGGQQQRVGLARALLANPPILLMDEPFGALDNVTRASIHREFKALEELKQKTIVMVTHDVDEAFELADRICLMDQGEIVQIGTPKELLFQPSNAFAKAFLDNQRLALEFKVVRLSDIWMHLQMHPDNLLTPQITDNLSVWEVLEQLKQFETTEIIIENSNKDRRLISFESVLNAFNCHQNQLKR